MTSTINKERLQQLSKAKSFEKGEAYFLHKAVKSVVKNGNAYKGKVEGSELYQVTLEVKSYDITAYCNCPYSFEGLCKHSVAVGLAIIAGEYSEQTAATTEQIVYHQVPTNTPQNRIANNANIDANNFYDQVFAAAPVNVQKAFLRQLFKKKEELRAQFINFTEKGQQITSAISSDIEMIRDEVFRELKSLEFGYEVFDYVNQRDYGGEEWELAYDGGIQMIEEVFEGYEKNAINHIQRGNLMAGMSVLLGLYEGYYNVDAPAIDQYSNFEAYNNEWNSIFVQVAVKIAQEVQLAIKTEVIVNQLIDLIFERVNYYTSGKATMEDEVGIVYEPKKIEALLKALVMDETTASYLQQQMDICNWKDRQSAYIRLKIARELADHETWIQIAETFAGQEIELVAQLLNKYEELGRIKDFYRIAKKAFKIWPYQVDEQLLDKINPKQDRAFYIKVLSNYTSRKANILTYQKLREVWTNSQKEQFIEKNSSQEVFYVQMLKIEKRYEDILQYVREHLSSLNFLQLITPIVAIFPEACFDIIQEKSLETLEEGRGRNIYRDVASWLSLLKNLKGKEVEVRQLVERIYNGPPRLPALKDEIKKAGLI
ncbi:MAG: SWIM zinc finger domain-containing protein [Chitinophagales bacterium]